MYRRIGMERRSMPDALFLNTEEISCKLDGAILFYIISLVQRTSFKPYRAVLVVFGINRRQTYSG
jgi:hypothetical protein